MTLKTAYMVMAIVGAALPVYFFVGFAVSEGFDLIAFAQALFSNGASAGFATDLFISSFVFWLFMFSRKDGPRPWLYIVLNLTVGLSLALPLYFWVSEAQNRAN
ncbi:MAG: DUF2834 domain-containing protein [Gammaproteobacteria bacterium]|nr:DUF2834 domain-containing protein [Gammaproteobacteria bacterium]MDD9958969.1 DUF2834 domain-containing protein [Gammaproteobacteria bacterium]